MSEFPQHLNEEVLPFGDHVTEKEKKEAIRIFLDRMKMRSSQVNPAKTLQNLKEKHPDFSSFSSVQTLSGILIIENKEKQQLRINLSSGEVIKDFGEKLTETIKQAEEEVRYIKGLLEIIFQKNEAEWFGKIDDSDYVGLDEIVQLSTKMSLGGEAKRKIQGLYHGWTLEMLMSKYREHISFLSGTYATQKNAGESETTLKKSLIEDQKYAMKLSAGVSDKYEGGALYFSAKKLSLQEKSSNTKAATETTQVTMSGEEITSKELEMTDPVQESLEKDISLYLSGVETEAALLFLEEVIIEMNDNKKKSDAVTSQNYNFLNIYGNILFSQMKKKGEAPEKILKLGRLLTGRDQSLSLSLQQPHLGEKIANYLMGIPGGPMQEIYECGATIEDPNIGEKTSTEVLNEFVTTMQGALTNEHFPVESHMATEYYTHLFGFQSEGVSADKKYGELGMQQQVTLSLIAELTKKIKEKGSIEETDIEGIYFEIMDDKIASLQEKYEKCFENWWGGQKDAIDFGLEGTDKDIYDFYVDVTGVGWFDLKDRFQTGTGKFVYDIGKNIGPIIIAGIGLTIAFPAMGLVAAGTAAGAIGFGVSNLVSEKGYDTEKELYQDLSTDLAGSVATGGAAGKLTQVGWKSFASRAKWKDLNGTVISKIGQKTGNWSKDWLATWQAAQNAGTIVGDIAILSLGLEIVRTGIIEGKWNAENYGKVKSVEEKDEARLGGAS